MSGNKIKMKKLTIIGAGPVGLETALYAKNLGFLVKVIEKGQIADNLKKWGHVTFFSPFYMNSSDLGKSIANSDIADHECCTAKKYINYYLKPIADYLKDNLVLDTKVLQISKKNILKGELIGSPGRTKEQFVILVKNKQKEYYLESDIVIDCSGVYDNPLSFGMGGLKVLNQENFENKINSYIPDLKSKDKEKYTGKKTLLIGTGYSAATTAQLFTDLIKKNDSTYLYWLSHNSKDKPFIEIENDILESRRNLIQSSNHIASGNQKNIEFINNSYIENLENYNDQIKVKYNKNGETYKLIVDQIISNVGYKPDNSIYNELQVHECYASQGIMKLASILLSSTSADCLSQNSAGADTLRNPEPNFYIIGSKSYGRNSNFILKVGYEQIKDIFQLIQD